MPHPTEGIATALPRHVWRYLLAVFLGLSMGATALTVGSPHYEAVAKSMTKFEATWIARQAQRALAALRGAESLNPAEQRDLVTRWSDSIALSVALDLGVDVGALQRAWRSASLERQRVLFAALSQLGVPYKLNADQPGIALDCSALTKFAWTTAGTSIPRSSAQQYAASTRVKNDEVQVGDLAWYPGHIMMSLGIPNVIVHTRDYGRSVEVSVISEERSDWIRWVDPT